MEKKVEGIEIGKQLPDFVLLQPGHYPARSGKFFNRILSWREIEYFLTYISKSEIVAVDLETRGNDYSDSSLEIVGVGLAWDTGSCYIPYTDIPSMEQDMVKQFLLTHPGLIAHNVYFDGGVLYSKYHEHPNWYVDTLSLYMQSANEGYAGQTHGLKDAQTRLLGWESSNETELDEWLVTNGYYRGNRYKDESKEHLLHMYRTGATSPEKGEMWRAPIHILGKYCILDAESTYLLYTHILRPVLDKFPALASYHIERFIPLIKLHIEQKMWGILMDREGLLARQEYLTKMIDEYSTKFITHSTVLPGIQQIESEMRQELAEKEPERYKKLKPMPEEPAKYTKSGQLNKNWEKWHNNRDRYLVPEVSKNWLNWQEKWKLAVAGKDPNYRFNLNSGPQLRKLIYEILGHPVEITTESGEPAIGIKALKKLDAPFDLLIERNYLVKELTYISDYLERVEHRDTMHPSFRLPGTSTGRLSSKGPNLQQVPKSKAVMSLFQARPGNVWVDLDFAALEPTVTAEFTGDKNMQFIYGNGAGPSDIYLFVGAQIPGRIGDAIRATGFDPYNPTKETLARAKKECKSERSVCKTVVLACGYGAGVNKVNATLEADNIYLPEHEVRQVWETYWNTFADVKKFGYTLESEWRRNGGYILNGLGRPMCVTEDYKKDLLNRFIQSTGHDILIEYILIVAEELDRSGIPWQPSILDWHDATAVEVPEKYGEQVAKLFLKCVDILNDKLQGTIKLRGTPMIGVNLAETKEAEE